MLVVRYRRMLIKVGFNEFCQQKDFVIVSKVCLVSDFLVNRATKKEQSFLATAL